MVPARVAIQVRGRPGRSEVGELRKKARFVTVGLDHSVPKACLPDRLVTVRLDVDRMLNEGSRNRLVTVGLYLDPVLTASLQNRLVTVGGRRSSAECGAAEPFGNGGATARIARKYAFAEPFGNGEPPSSVGSAVRRQGLTVSVAFQPFQHSARASRDRLVTVPFSLPM